MKQSRFQPVYLAAGVAKAGDSHDGVITEVQQAG
jgi:hypothetical protein